MVERLIDGYWVTDEATDDAGEIWPVLRLDPEGGGELIYRRILEGRKFQSLKEAHNAAAEALLHLTRITEDGELIFSPSS